MKKHSDSAHSNSSLKYLERSYGLSGQTGQTDQLDKTQNSFSQLNPLKKTKTSHDTSLISPSGMVHPQF